MHPDGSDLSGLNEGDWQKNWVVIGTDTYPKCWISQATLYK
ncbi:hypothetical protein [Photobacterium angustum]|nr:hypothetical protein [Photobacterium angustum]